MDQKLYLLFKFLDVGLNHARHVYTMQMQHVIRDALDNLPVQITTDL